MYGVTDYAGCEAITSLSFSGDMLPTALMSKLLSLFYHPDIRRVSFSVELFSNAFLQMFDLTLSMTTPLTPSP